MTGAKEEKVTYFVTSALIVPFSAYLSDIHTYNVIFSSRLISKPVSGISSLLRSSMSSI